MLCLIDRVLQNSLPSCLVRDSAIPRLYRPYRTKQTGLIRGNQDDSKDLWKKPLTRTLSLGAFGLAVTQKCWQEDRKNAIAREQCEG